ncbi:MAG: HlyD family secretion protein [Asticcacaulis sp.]|nr:HlyD family secretion protein [Asticcacaulis sp.]
MSDDSSPRPTPTAAPDTATPPPVWRPPTRPGIVTAIFVILAVIAVVLILMAWGIGPFSGGAQTTQNAYVRGRTAVIAPQVSGYVTDVLIRDYETVQAGQVLAKIDDRIYQQRGAAAEANVAAAEASLANSTQARAARTAALQGQQASVANAEAQLLRAQADMRRADELVRDGSISIRERDATVAALRAAEAAVGQARAQAGVGRQDIRTVEVGRGGLQAQVEAARAQLNLARIDLANTVIRAPETGQVGEVGVRRGQYVTNGTQLLALVPPDRWVIANYKETQTARMAVGQPVTLRVDALGDARLNGHVERISPAAGSEFSVIRPDNGTGNFVKIPQRIGVRIRIDPGQALAARLRPGMSVETRVDTRVRP